MNPGTKVNREVPGAGSDGIAAAARRYYENFADRGDFREVPMADELVFTGPLQQYNGGDRYRAGCRELAARTVALTIRHQILEESEPGSGRTHTVYDLDLGLRSGPIASSETLTFRHGEMTAAELIIDSRPIIDVGPAVSASTRTGEKP